MIVRPESVGIEKKNECRCGGRSVYYRAYNGESLCAKCFNGSIVEKTKKTISRYSMLRYSDKLGVALSGGKDSTSLLYVLKEITRGRGTDLYAITVDEGISGYREEAIDNARCLAERLGVPLLVCSYKELFGFSLDEALQRRGRDANRSRVTSCAVCGPLRRRSMDNAARRLGVKVLATAHNLDDVLQTFFINMHSGDIERIRWLDPAFSGNDAFGLRRVKPFLEIYERELAFFAYLNGLPFQSESCPYMNEGIRTEIRENLNRLESRHPGIKYSTLKTLLAVSSRLGSPGGSGLNGKKATTCSVCGSVSSGSVCSVCQTLESVSAYGAADQ